MRASRHTVPPPQTPAAASWRRRWTSASPLARDVIVILAIKAAALALIWFAFFRTPAAPQMTMNPGQVGDRIVAPAFVPKAPHAEP
jgi:hypothetical protein